MRERGKGLDYRVLAQGEGCLYRSFPILINTWLHSLLGGTSGNIDERRKES